MKVISNGSFVVSITLSAMLFALCPVSDAQQAKRLARVGVLVSGSP